MGAPGSQALRMAYNKSQGSDPLSQLAPYMSQWVQDQNQGEGIAQNLFGGLGIMQGGGSGGPRQPIGGQPMEEMAPMRGRVGGLIGQVTGMFG